MTEATGSSRDEAPGEVIEAGVSPWFYRRCVVMIALLTSIAGYFSYQSLIAVPSQIRQADVYYAFFLGRDGPAGSPDQNDSVLASARQAGADGESWEAFARQHGLSVREPLRPSVETVAGYRRVAVALGLAALLTVAWTLMHRGRCWSMKDGRIRSPWHTEFAADSVTDIDRRRWSQGVALLISRDNDRLLKLKLDDYKYRGAARIVPAIARAHPEVRIDPPLSIPPDRRSSRGGG